MGSVGFKWWSVGLHGGVLGYMVGFVGLHCEGLLGYIVGCRVTWWVLFSSIMGSVGLHSGECLVKWWGVLGYVVGYCVTWWRLLSFMVESVGLHGGECWVIWWGVLDYMVEGYIVRSVGLCTLFFSYCLFLCVF